MNSSGLRRAARAAAQLADHDVHRLDRLAVEVAAALGPGLVLQLDAAGPGLLEAPHGVRHVRHVAVAGVGVDQHRQVGTAAHGGQAVEDLAQSGQADVGLARRPARRRVAAQVEAGEAGGHRRDRLERRADPRAGPAAPRWTRSGRRTLADRCSRGLPSALHPAASVSTAPNSVVCKTVWRNSNYERENPCRARSIVSRLRTTSRARGCAWQRSTSPRPRCAGSSSAGSCQPGDRLGEVELAEQPGHEPHARPRGAASLVLAGAGRGRRAPGRSRDVVVRARARPGLRAPRPRSRGWRRRRRGQAAT